jgi:hypothetical protein
MKKITYIFILILILVSSQVISLEQKKESVPILPSYFNYRDIDGVDYTTPIKDQSPAPTCEAYGLVASLETIMQYGSNEIFNPDLSECHLYFYAGGTYEAGYVNLMDAANYLINYGVPDEGCYPDPHRPFDYPFESVQGWENRTVKIQDWGWVEKDVEHMKSALIEYGPLVICLSVYKDFMYYRRGVYTHVWGDRVGGHVVTIVGYDDSHNCWIVKNSWGKKWGEDGWFRLSYDADLFAEWYGPGTGVMYLDGVYGNFEPDVPKLKIKTPKIYKTYIFGFEIPRIIKKLPIQAGAPRLIGDLTFKIDAENTDSVDFYLDGLFVYTDYDEPFEWPIEASRGIHTLEARAKKSDNISLAIVDFYVMI